MQGFFFFLILVLTSVLVYKWSYNKLWFKLHLLFDEISSANWENVSSMPENWNQNANLYTRDTFMQKFYTEYSLSSNRIAGYLRILFSVAMACYFVTIEIILISIKISDGTKQADFITTVVWPFTALLLSLILILIQPFCILISILNKFFNDKLDMDRLIMATTAVIGGLIMILSIVDFGPFAFTNNILTRLSIAGITLMAYLSGIACVSTVYYICLFVWHKNTNKGASPISSNSISNSFQKQNFLLWSSRESLERRSQDYEYKIKQLLDKMHQENDYLTSNMKNKYMDVLGKYQLSLTKINSALQQPYKMLVTKRICSSMFIIYCIHRITFTFMVKIPRIVSHFVSYPHDYKYNHFENKSDPLAVTFANILDVLLFHFNYQHDLESLKSQISLFLSASLFIGSISTVYTTISFIIGLLPVRFQMVAMYAMSNNMEEEELPFFNNNSTNCDKNIHLNRNPSMIKNLLVSELTGIYVIGTVLMIRSNLPFDMALKLKNLLGEKFTVPNVTIDCWFDEMFAFACVFTFIGIKVAEIYLTNNSSTSNLLKKDNRLIN
ncbi:hypothetical protein MOUN0_H04786 [Monosporozyma unispora]